MLLLLLLVCCAYVWYSALKQRSPTRSPTVRKANNSHIIMQRNGAESKMDDNHVKNATDNGSNSRFVNSFM